MSQGRFTVLGSVRREKVWPSVPHSSSGAFRWIVPLVRSIKRSASTSRCLMDCRMGACLSSPRSLPRSLTPVYSDVSSRKPSREPPARACVLVWSHYLFTGNSLCGGDGCNGQGTGSGNLTGGVVVSVPPPLPFNRRYRSGKLRTYSPYRATNTARTLPVVTRTRRRRRLLPANFATTLLPFCTRYWTRRLDPPSSSGCSPTYPGRC